MGFETETLGQDIYIGTHVFFLSFSVKKTIHVFVVIQKHTLEFFSLPFCKMGSMVMTHYVQYIFYCKIQMCLFG